MIFDPERYAGKILPETRAESELARKAKIDLERQTAEASATLRKKGIEPTAETLVVLPPGFKVPI